jgi:hypothetical protein
MASFSVLQEAPWASAALDSASAVLLATLPVATSAVSDFSYAKTSQAKGKVQGNARICRKSYYWPSSPTAYSAGHQ